MGNKGPDSNGHLNDYRTPSEERLAQQSKEMGELYDLMNRLAAQNQLWINQLSDPDTKLFDRFGLQMSKAIMATVGDQADWKRIGDEVAERIYIGLLRALIIGLEAGRTAYLFTEYKRTPLSKSDLW